MTLTIDRHADGRLTAPALPSQVEVTAGAIDEPAPATAYLSRYGLVEQAPTAPKPLDRRGELLVVALENALATYRITAARQSPSEALTFEANLVEGFITLTYPGCDLPCGVCQRRSPDSPLP